MTTANTTANATATTGRVRIFHEGTEFFVTEVNPYDVMAQRGDEMHLLFQADDTIDTEAELRREVMRSDLTDSVYLNILFDTPAEEVKWWQEAA